jgi:hypothetical protein
MMRREFILGVGAGTLWPAVARGQRPPMPVIGYVSALSPQPNFHLLEIMRRSLADGGFSKGAT